MDLTHALALLALAPSLAPAQQFQHLVGLLPGTPRWTEGVEAADVDRDGDLDLFFADGEGFNAAGVKRQNVLLVNQFVPNGTLSFTDESVARLGTRVSNAKAVITGDVNGDGWVDALVCNAWDTDVPFLYINHGASNPGFFTMESATRGFTTAVSSGGGQFADIDDDGDLDLVLNDAYLGTAARRPRVYFNDGAGAFTYTAAAMVAAPTKTAQMETHLADIDNDWDIDFIGFTRAANGGTNHYVLLNNGSGTFATTTNMIPSNSGATYAGEVGDLDGDSDIDLFLVSLSSFAEGAIRNNLAPSGTLGFTALTALADSNDDNEICLFDWDIDGDYDVIVGSLSNTRETLWTNGGSGNFTHAGATIISAVSDPTLDATVADLDNDGRYDIVTAQGEGSSAQWANKVYRNTGPIDTRKPVLVGTKEPATMPAAGPWKVRAKVRDQVFDNGLNWVAASARYVVRTQTAVESVLITASGLSNAAVTIPAGGIVRMTAVAGAQTVRFTNAPYDHTVAVPGAGMADVALVAPGVYAYTVQPSGFNGTITVTGSATTVAGQHSGGQLYRFLFADTSGGTGKALVYELAFKDAAGNTLVSAPRTLSLTDCSLSTYCTAKTNSLGCVPSILMTGTPSTVSGTGFQVGATSVLNQKSGLFFYSLSGAVAQPFQGGTMCIAAPRQRSAILSSGGAASGNDCSGSFGLDFNAEMRAHPTRFAVGDTVTGQFWSRDPADPFQTSLSDAVRACLCQ
ncbi:MAG: VCBS repeat-containing protein [Planctomycetes bacterium]|nr:VCBS repeat-containing protein [Planctomycetota bacterium]